MTPTIRIHTGRLRGRVLSVPAGIRPTSGRVRESLLDIWAPRLPGAYFLDLCAGSGAVGIEAVSRGAGQLVAVERDSLVRRQLKINLQLLSVGDATLQVAEIPADLPKLSRAFEHEFDLIFADPPYDFVGYSELVAGLDALLAPGGEIAVEHECRNELAESYVAMARCDRRRYGDTCLSFFRLDPKAQD